MGLKSTTSTANRPRPPHYPSQSLFLTFFRMIVNKKAHALTVKSLENKDETSSGTCDSVRRAEVFSECTVLHTQTKGTQFESKVKGQRDRGRDQ